MSDSDSEDEKKHYHGPGKRSCRICRNKFCNSCTKWYTFHGCERCRTYYVCGNWSCLYSAKENDVKSEKCSLCLENEADCGHVTRTPSTCKNCNASSCSSCSTYWPCQGARHQFERCNKSVCSLCEPACEQCKVIVKCGNCQKNVMSFEAMAIRCSGNLCKAWQNWCRDCHTHQKYSCKECSTATPCGVCKGISQKGSLNPCYFCRLLTCQMHETCKSVLIADNQTCRQCALKTHAELVPGKWIERKINQNFRGAKCSVVGCRREGTVNPNQKCSHNTEDYYHHILELVCVLHQDTTKSRLQICSSCKLGTCLVHAVLSSCSTVACLSQWCQRCIKSNTDLYGHTRFLFAQTGVWEDECLQCDLCQVEARKTIEAYMPKTIASLVYSYIL